jgi:prepilin-type processing-associated H-X9-DG protein/prepilin-type N-terminal cleavage/methylation domain-containing protein
MKAQKGTGIAFTLVELLTVIAVLAVLAAILLPVFAQARESARRSNCLTNQHQLGLGVLQYAQDWDETFPNGLYQSSGKRVWPGQGWAGQCMPYIRSSKLFHCPSDHSTPPPGNSLVSYGLNKNLIRYGDIDDPMPSGVHLSELRASTRTVMLFEVANIFVKILSPWEGADIGGSTGNDGGYEPYQAPAIDGSVVHFSASGNGLDNRLYAQPDWSTSPENQYATGYLGGRTPFDPKVTQFPTPEGRHQGGSNFLFCDGHVVWLRGSRVSSGLSSPAEHCNQDNEPPLPGCNSVFRAAGTGNSGFVGTFSPL